MARRNGQVHFADTMSEVDGLILCQAQEPDEEDEFDDYYWVAGWLVMRTWMDEFAQRIEIELGQAWAALVK